MGMKNSHIAFWIAVAGAVFFFYNIHEIHGIEEEAAVWQSNVQANDNPGASSYIKAFFDGATLGAFSNGDIFAEAHNQEKMSAELETTRKILLKR